MVVEVDMLAMLEDFILGATIPSGDEIVKEQFLGAVSFYGAG